VASADMTGAGSTAESTTDHSILTVERYNPVFSAVVPEGTQEERIGLPETLRAIFALPEDAEDSSFIQEEPAADTSDGTLQYDYFNYGYICPEDADARYARGERVIYTITYAARNEDGTPADDSGETAYRVYGHLPGVSEGEARWFTCTEEGQITGFIENIPVTWEDVTGYDGNTPGTYRYAAVLADYTYDGEQPYAEILVEPAEAAGAFDDHEHEEEELAGEEAPVSQPMGIAPLSINGNNGANDTNGDAIMVANAPTSGNVLTDINQYDTTLNGTVTVPGIWSDYINTMWMNKAYNSFAWKPADETGAWNGWAWDGTTAVSGESGTSQTNPKHLPETTAYTNPHNNKSCKIYQVYSGQQLRYAMGNMTGDDYIYLEANINLNGSEYAWPTLNRSNRGLRINGQGHTIYNLGITSNKSNSSGGNEGSFAKNYYSLEITDLTFANVKIVNTTTDTNDQNKYTGLFYSTILSDNNAQRILRNVEVMDSLFFGRDIVSPLGAVGGLNTLTISGCSTHDNYIYGRNHLGGFCTNINGGTVTNCGTWNTLMCGTGGHSSGFIPCFSQGGNTIRNCFTSVELYGSRYVGGFTTILGGNISNCYATGKVEGYTEIGGFLATTGEEEQTINNCYSTCLVGLRSPADIQGGFAAPYASGTSNNNVLHIQNAYAGGEVGNTDTNLDDPVDVGGFFSLSSLSIIDTGSLNHNYYDKQTTAMREWACGDTKTLAGVSGVLTTTSAKGGTGLASGGYGSTGFQGFSDNSAWVYTAEHYPQLKVFAAPNASDWGGVPVDVVKANSLASTATVFLDTWDSGYDWDAFGMRSDEEESYNRSYEADHVGYAYTYDTVRSIVSDAPVTSTAGWEHMIPGGAPVDENNDGAVESGVHAMDITAQDGITILAPGMDWFRIRESSGSATGSRPIRLISFALVEAGPDVTVSGGSIFDHKSGVKLTLMDSVTPNLVVGMHDQLAWSVAEQYPYPTSGAFFAAEPANMDPDMTEAENAWVYTEIWTAEQLPDGSYVTDGAVGWGSEKLVPLSLVPVTGNPVDTTEQQRWNGEIPHYTAGFQDEKYIINYYWMLKDGRYRTDTKIVTVTPFIYRPELPMTGGMGVAPFCFGGAACLGLAAGLLFVRRKRHREKGST
jgi:LPXTG-motif cell wall-anchored protein